MGVVASAPGKSGEDLYIRVPVGTVVHEADTQELIGELVHAEDRLLVARGGRRGLGNTRFKSSTNRAPRKTTQGKPGESEAAAPGAQAAGRRRAAGFAKRRQEHADPGHLGGPTKGRGLSVYDGAPESGCRADLRRTAASWSPTSRGSSKGRPSGARAGAAFSEAHLPHAVVAARGGCGIGGSV